MDNVLFKCSLTIHFLFYLFHCSLCSFFVIQVAPIKRLHEGNHYICEIVCNMPSSHPGPINYQPMILSVYNFCQAAN